MSPAPDPAPRPALVILAAGASRRLGACKALVDLGGCTPLEHLTRAGRCLDSVPPIVVTGADDPAIRARVPSGVEVLFNPEWARGRTGGVLLARDARPGHDLALAPVDCPLVPASVFEALLAEWLRSGCPARGWLAPRHRAAQAPSPGRHGHPIVVGRELMLQLARDPGRSLRDLRERAEPLWALPVEVPEVLDDLDRPIDLDRMRARLGHRASDRP